MTIYNYVSSQSLVLKIPEPNGTITIPGNFKRTYEYEQEHTLIFDSLITKLNFHEAKAITIVDESPPSKGQLGSAPFLSVKASKTMHICHDDPTKSHARHFCQRGA
jgi:hypothetical protein